MGDNERHVQHSCDLAGKIEHGIIYILNIFNLFQSVCLFIRTLVRGIKNGHLIGQRNDVTAWPHGRSGSVNVPRHQSSLRHSALLSLGLPGATRTCAEVYCYFLVRGNCSGYWYVGIFVSLFGYFSCQRSGLVKALSLLHSKLLRRKLAWLRHCLIG